MYVSLESDVLTKDTVRGCLRCFGLSHGTFRRESSQSHTSEDPLHYLVVLMKGHYSLIQLLP